MYSFKQWKDIVENFLFPCQELSIFIENSLAEKFIINIVSYFLNIELKISWDWKVL